MFGKTVIVIRNFLNDELSKYDTREEFEKSGLIKISGQDWLSREFIKRKKEGVGRETIQKFLGKNWKQHNFQHPFRDT